MAINRPNDSHAPSPQELAGVDPFRSKVDMLQVVNPELDNGRPWKAGNLPEMQAIGRTTGPGQTNTAEMILARHQLMDPRLSQNRSY